MYDNNYPNDLEGRNVIDNNPKTEEDSRTAGGYYRDFDQNDTAGSSNSSFRHYDYKAEDNRFHSGAAEPVKMKKESKPHPVLKKFIATVCLGLFFGVCAGLGFFAVVSATGGLPQTENNAAALESRGVAADSSDVYQGDTIEATNSTTAVVTDVTNVVKEVMPAIVSINNMYTETMTSYFGQSMTNEANAAGSGIIVGESDTELLIVTNYHVVSESDKLTIKFVDGSEAEAQIKGSDSSMDLAVIAVPLDSVESSTRAAIAVATLGDSDSLTVGEPAIAIGNSLGYGQSVTVGVVSAVDRVIDITENMEGSFIQTDAAINPGNSGGALLNMQGQVIGINSNKIGGSVIEGMGYAIPISAAKPIIEDLMLRETRNKVTEEERGYLGVSLLNVVDQMTQDYGMPKGVYVSQVYSGTAADAAGIVKGNIITQFDGRKVNSAEDLMEIMQYYSKGDTVQVTVMQGSPTGWDSKDVTVTLGGKAQ